MSEEQPRAVKTPKESSNPKDETPTSRRTWNGLERLFERPWSEEQPRPVKAPKEPLNPTNEPQMSGRIWYGFEGFFEVPKTEKGENNHNQKVSGFYRKFLKNLRLDEEKLNENAKALLKRYVANVHVNCSWYDRKVRSEKAIQIAYFVVSVALLILIPLIIYFSPSLLDWIGKQIGSTRYTAYADNTARLTTLLAGFFAVYRAIFAWLNQRKLIGPYWKARSDLLNETYTLETKWGLKEESKKLKEKELTKEFNQAIEASLKAARDIVQTEREQFYTNYTFPEVKLGDSLSDASTTAGNLIKVFESAHTKRQRELAKTRETHAIKHDSLKAEVAGLTAILDEWNVELGAKRTELDGETDDNIKQKLESEIASIVTEIAKLTTQRKLKIQQQAQERVRAGLE